MNKTLAAFGATAMGLGLVGAGAAAPATAASDPAVACENMNEQVAETGNLSENWYQSCIPQYGLGKAEFTIVADLDDPEAEFPEGFTSLLDLDDDAITSTNDVAAQSEYLRDFEGGLSFAAPIVPGQLIEETPSSQQYFAAVVAPVTSVGTVDLDTVPAQVAQQCLAGDPVYAGAWVAEFGSVNTTFTQTIGGQPWNYTVTAAPKTTYFFGSFPLDENVWCATDGTYTINSANQVSGGETVFGLVMNRLLNLDAGSIDEFLVSLGTFGRDVPAVAAPSPTLADTGANAAPLAIAAGSFTAFGLALLGFVSFAGRRRARV